jgi:hypothetical protein
VSDVQVVFVVTLPEEGRAARDPLDVSRVDSARAQKLGVFVREVISHRSDDLHVAEEARREGEVDRGSAQHAIALAERRAN